VLAYNCAYIIKKSPNVVKQWLLAPGGVLRWNLYGEVRLGFSTPPPPWAFSALHEYGFKSYITPPLHDFILYPPFPVVTNLFYPTRLYSFNHRGSPKARGLKVITIYTMYLLFSFICSKYMLYNCYRPSNKFQRVTVVLIPGDFTVPWLSDWNKVGPS
jgi:hypothetical protein